MSAGAPSLTESVRVRRQQREGKQESGSAGVPEAGRGRGRDAARKEERTRPAGEKGNCKTGSQAPTRAEQASRVRASSPQ